MAGRKLSRANMAHINAAAEHLHAMGAKHPGTPDYTPIGKADMSLGERLSALHTAVSMAVPNLDYSYPYVRDDGDGWVVIELGDTCYKADYTTADDGAVTLAARDAWVEVEEVWTPVQANGAKAGLIAAEATETHYASIKALADRHLEVKVAYYGHKNGKDSHNEFFSPRTDFGVDDWPTPPLLYYHGFDESNRKMSKPVVTGKFVSRRAGDDGHYLTYKLRSGRYADEQWESALKGECVVSPGTVGHLIRPGDDGELLYWPLAEISAWKYDAKRPPANLHSVAAPVIKALYLSENLTIPETLNAPETTGEVVAGDADTPLTSDEQARLAARIVADQLRTYRKELQKL